MAPTNPLDELRRRIGHGTTPVAFAALAEEHRRAGRFDEAVAVCREGLERYPTYASARVTLGRALLDSGDVRGALSELLVAVTQAPDNLAAARALDMVRLRIGDEDEAAIPADAIHEAATLESMADAAFPADALAWLGPGAEEAADTASEASFASEASAAGDEWSVAEDAPQILDATVAESLWDAIAPSPAGQDAPFSWGAAPLATSSDSAFASWNASVEDAVAHVFTEAGGGPAPIAPTDDAAPIADSPVDSIDDAVAEPIAEPMTEPMAEPIDEPLAEPIDDPIDDPVDDPLGSLQTLLATIRARRALLAEPQSGVD